MIHAALPDNETLRLAALYEYDVLEGLPEDAYCDLTYLASRFFGTPIATLSMIDSHRQVFRAALGLALTETPRDISFCSHAILQPDVFVVPDATRDERFADNPLVTGDAHIRFYAGVPLIAQNGCALGTLCVIDTVPRELDQEHLEAMRVLGRQVMVHLEARRSELARQRAEGAREEAQEKLVQHMRALEEQTQALTDSRHALQRTAEELTETNLMLAQASNRFQELFQGLPVACFCYDAMGRVYEWNRACETVYGWHSDQVFQKPFYETLCSEQTLARTQDIVKRVFEGESFAGLEWEDALPDGTVRTVLCSTFPLRGPSGQIVGAISASVDISARKRTEKALQESQQRLRTVIENAPLVLFAIDREGRFTASEGKGLEALGLTSGEVVGQSVFELYKEHAGIQDDCRRALSGEKLVTSRVLGDLAFETWYMPLADARGDNDGLIGVSTDTTQRQRAEDALRQANDSLERRIWERTQELAKTNVALHQQIEERKDAEEELQRVLAQSEQIVGSITSILIAVDETGLVTAWNTTAQRIFGRAASDTLGQPLAKCGVAWDWPRIAEAMTECQEQGVIRLDDLRYTRLDGKEALLGMSLNPIQTMQGAPLGILVLANDVTERRMLEGQLAQAQKMESIGQLAAGIAHEINTPIQYVGDNARFLQDAFSDLHPLLEASAKLLEQDGNVPDAQIAALRETARAADLDYLLSEVPSAITQTLEGVERVAHIIRAMKEFSHPGSVEKTPIDLNHALESTITVTRSEWKYVADLVTDFDTSLPLLRCLPQELNQVFLNMIINAVHAIKDAVAEGAHGTLTVRTFRQGEWAKVQFQDTGCGIPAALQTRIFDPFFTTKEVGKGTGQGLAISHAVVVEKHGGRIEIESAVGQGTTFTISLPLGSEGGDSPA